MKYLFILCCCLPSLLWSQQTPYTTAFPDMQFGWNPATTAPWSTIKTSAVYHQQWVGFDDAPRTMLAGFQAPIQKMNMSLGLQLMQDEVGFLQQTGLSFSYAYHLDLAQQGRLAIGLLANYSQFRYDASNLLVFDIDDQLLGFAEGKSNAPNFSAGLYYTSVGADDYDESHFFIGLSAMQALPNNLQFSAINELATIKQALHAFGHLGYRFAMDQGTLEPALQVLYSADNIAHLQFDVRYEAYDAFWVGLSIDAAFRTGFQLGLILPDIGDGSIRVGAKASYNISSKGSEQGISYQALVAYDYNL